MLRMCLTVFLVRSWGRVDFRMGVVEAKEQDHPGSIRHSQPHVTCALLSDAAQIRNLSICPSKLLLPVRLEP
ncbi:hypothetical protein BKA70DRAFT_1282641 [Coprinopsis sp. MPI-PUGE-AT-0042]|nr:hypothetical protein BKA70DRAFT_1282641 [Coprinopsis sp. MPI-PUGE-AT-0042]